MSRSFLLKAFLLLLAASALYLVGNSSIALFDRDEPRYAQASRQMLQSGDWIVPRLMEEIRGAKPIFIYWCQAAAMRLLGDNAFAARLPSVIGMLLTLALLLACLGRWIGRRRALWTVFIFSTTALAIAAAKMSITDAVLLLFVTSAQLCLYAMLRGQTSIIVTSLFGLSIGLAGLTKGPVVLGVLTATLVALALLNWIDRKQPWRDRATMRLSAGRRLLHLPGASIVKGLWVIALVAIVVAPWLIAMERRNPGYFANTLFNEVIKRAGKPLEGHKGPPGYYLLLVWATYFPWSLLLPTALTMAWRHRKVPAIRFALSAIVGPWVMFELVQTKLPHYVLPTYPFLAFLAADALIRCIRRQHDDLVRRRFVVMTAIWSTVTLIVGLAPWSMFAVLGALSERLVNAMTLLSALALAWAIVVFRHVRAQRLAAAGVSMGTGMLVMVFLLSEWYLPRAQFLRLSPNIAEVLIDNGATHLGDVISIGYKEPSLVFHQGGTLRPVEKEFLLTHPRGDWPRWIVIKQSIWQALPPAICDEFDIIASFRGINYADDPQPIEVMVIRRRS